MTKSVVAVSILYLSGVQKCREKRAKSSLCRKLRWSNEVLVSFLLSIIKSTSELETGVHHENIIARLMFALHFI